MIDHEERVGEERKLKHTSERWRRDLDLLIKEGESTAEENRETRRLRERGLHHVKTRPEKRSTEMCTRSAEMCE